MDHIVALTCNESHTFHPACLEEWLTRSPECPLCKTDVFSASIEREMRLSMVSASEDRQVLRSNQQ